MSVDSSTVARIAGLARLKVSDDRLDGLAGELNTILDFFEQLREVNTDDVPPMASVSDVTLPLRDDVGTDGDRAEDVLANGPETDHGFYVVPKVVE
jgi:aspartyl-tRNA(Asn)/glutamyl-tRNA(Gln) amidotransferase subunit C